MVYIVINTFTFLKVKKEKDTHHAIVIENNYSVDNHFLHNCRIFDVFKEISPQTHGNDKDG
jgi:hypothetical protein